MSKYHRFVRPAPAFESAPEGGRVVSGGGRSRGARLRGGSSLQVMSDAIERAVQNGKGGRSQRGKGKAPRPSAMRGGECPKIQRLHVGFGGRKQQGRGRAPPLRGGSKLLMKGAGLPPRERGSMMRGGGDGGGAPPMSAVDGSTPGTEADIASSGGGALGVGANMMQMQQINPRPQRYGGVRVAPMRLMVDRIPVSGQ